MVRQFSAGGVVYRKCKIENESFDKTQGKQFKIEWLVRKGRHNPEYAGSGEWSLPKGWLDDIGDKPGPRTMGNKRATKEEMVEAALREVREETGVDAKVVERLGDVKFFFVNSEKEKVFKTVVFYLMEYSHDLPEGHDSETEETRWVSVEEAKMLLKKRKGEAQMVEKAYAFVNSER